MYPLAIPCPICEGERASHDGLSISIFWRKPRQYTNIRCLVGSIWLALVAFVVAVAVTVTVTVALSVVWLMRLLRPTILAVVHV